ncbi:copper radical oxidase [Macrolepiota fuliginosa MF-IS2]|uniref:Copper radical oxidase n=1 Tax=Macrolepiota fuliginosa MF-IS2 TaxID=1400762 RepID=A0A9P5XBN7_9AGAR|nr:copper radical oxidase [Macrolepiota fuliginosa MF-IS2]
MGLLTPSALALALLFTPYLVANAQSSHSNHAFRHRRQTIPTLPGNWTSLGCYIDNTGAGRTLNAATFASGTTMTIESCINFCIQGHFIFAGTEFGNGGAPTASTDCNMRCSGNTQEPCGSGGRLNLFTSGGTPPPAPRIVPKVGDWVSLGCWTDAVNGAPRSLANAMNTNGPVDIETCTTACFNAGFHLSGTEFAGECYCDNALNAVSTKAADTDCNMVCVGNNTEFCGGPNRLNVYNYTGTALPANPGGGGGGGPGPGNVFPVLSGLPTGWAYNACWVDNTNGRILQNQIPDTPTMTVETCVQACAAQNFTVAGLEFSTQCFCGPALVAGAIPALESSCNMGCGGNTTEACGGPSRTSVYTLGHNLTVFPVPVAQKTNLPGNFTYAGCLHEAENSRILPWMLEWPTNNSATVCMEQCSQFGYPAAGVEFGIQCFCGDITDVTSANGVIGDEADCNIPCPGDPAHLCGGGARLNYYTWQGNLNVWHTPAVTGQYKFFVPGVIVPLIATVGINNKVSFLEKHGTGFPNSTGAYELDLSLASDFSKAWRQLNGLKSDVFCAGSVILPDKAGRQLNVGGWSLDSTFGVRLFTPNGVPGTNSTGDWEEDYPALTLQRGRWYPSAAVIPNGSVVVIGGEIGSNDKPQPNLEILPKPDGGDTVIDLPWLQRTDPNNLYPFVIVLPSKNIFVGYWNEARILEPVGFQTVKELPNIPGNVNNFLAGRTYPLEGAAMPLPQHAPYTNPLEILICGGSTDGGGEANDNCVTIQPEAANPQWVLERMPSKRVLACMVALPDGTYMIMNGATQGVAGFGLADNPNLGAVLYDPTLPRNQRMSILNNTIVARMYHSEAILLPDGRVLISGSDPQTDNPDGTVKYPEEFRVEVYIPPYLSTSLRQPTFTLPQHDFAYNAQFTITNVHLFQGPMSNLRISLIAATSSTHGNTMGARTIFPAFSCSGTTCTITTPPNAGVSPPGWHMLFVLDGPTPSVAQWVRIGGDPSELGNWPNIPGFILPGI